ncbi:MarR family winged helix-turn-helix transcriptional regulator [Caldimonas thermodepolymerans]|jgi:DNA-binding MarR family transcriptional regulator|uniref:MarR family transcriptional regulator n=2 Tax=Caldimonas thermodepolymerans TaxID=215580 RepID=A0AA46DHN5_9BURK|nr:MarR family transcriptional regulator [Caldimonas thermodepolymerans]RDI03796.1 MarR family transcriptional regulator [Caldimonas thermodepolymerans]TCP09763.1 MarR family transcriptional regulator [Caldimonas thermodepolymerans]UZG45879.1 MarR family transcriptional regulator [Caldimonas thermodepolymerans]UZG49773.1 MarR family transcriptional regulator [Caldimonas thermodepolymerans]
MTTLQGQPALQPPVREADYTGGAMPNTKSDSVAHGLDQSSLSHVLGYHLAQADVPIKKVFFKCIGQPLQLRPVEFTILMLLNSNENVTQKQLSQALAVSAPNITILLDRLAERGLVTRVRSETDRRSQHVLLTRKGAILARKAHEVSLTMEHEVLRHLSDGERAILFELLQKVARHRRV